MKEHASDVTRIMLLVLIIGLLLLGSFWTLLPFVGGLIWATTVVIATWPLLLSLQRLFGGRRMFAVVTMTLLVLLVFLAPFAVAISAILDVAARSPALLQKFLAHGLPAPPAWVDSIPLAGEELQQKWLALSAGGPDAVAEAVRPYVRSAAAWIVAATGGVGLLIVQGLLIVVLVAILYTQGEVAARGALAFGYRIGGERGEGTLVLASQAVRSVALGVIVTALVQSALAGIGLWVSGVPHAGVLAAIAFVLGVAQLGPLLVLLPAIVWLYWSGQPAWGTALLVWTLPVVALDNVLRPILIRRGVQLPMLLIIAGVIGGLMGFGVMGLFIGPVILAATYTLAKAWVVDDGQREITNNDKGAEQ